MLSLRTCTSLLKFSFEMQLQFELYSIKPNDNRKSSYIFAWFQDHKSAKFEKCWLRQITLHWKTWNSHLNELQNKAVLVITSIALFGNSFKFDCFMSRILCYNGVVQNAQDEDGRPILMIITVNSFRIEKSHELFLLLRTFVRFYARTRFINIIAIRKFIRSVVSMMN